MRASGMAELFKFQSHAGSIEAGEREGKMSRSLEFQSHAGSIEAASVGKRSG